MEKERGAEIGIERGIGMWIEIGIGIEIEIEKEREEERRDQGKECSGEEEETLQGIEGGVAAAETADNTPNADEDDND